MMKRRTALKIVALGTLAPTVRALASGARCLMAPGTAWSAASYKLQFFSAADNELLDRVMEMIIPADSHSPGAHAAQVSLFADLMVATGDDSTRARWRNGLRLMQEEAQKSSLAQALSVASANEGHPASELEGFFAELKRMTINGYYTSEIGIHQDLQYVGNTYLPEFPGCNHVEHSLDGTAAAVRPRVVTPEDTAAGVQAAAEVGRRLAGLPKSGENQERLNPKS
jgi:Gluconate 2-dehydrogenase subunit 3